jgi:AAA domain/Acetyltransferase (GNAT) domain
MEPVNGGVWFVTGAPGAGKTAVATHLARLLPDFVVLDMDALLEPASRLAGLDLRSAEAAPMWPAYNDVWVNVAAMVAATHPVLLLGPLTPDEVDDARSRSAIAAVEWALLDCSDQTRRKRLAQRGYGSAAIADAIADATATRALGLHAISTDDAEPSETAVEVARWATRSMPTDFVPANFAVPTEVIVGDLRLVPLGPEHNAADYAAWTSSIDHIRATPGFVARSWPVPMTLAENLRDLERHAEDFRQRQGFTYTVLDTNGEVIGCVYIYPSKDEHVDADVRSWVRADRGDQDRVLWEAVRAWLRADWPFAAVEYAERPPVE